MSLSDHSDLPWMPTSDLVLWSKLTPPYGWSLCFDWLLQVYALALGWSLCIDLILLFFPLLDTDWRTLRLGVLAHRTNRVPPIFFDWHESHLPLAGASYSVSPKPFQKITSLTIEPKLPEEIIIWFICLFFLIYFTSYSGLHIPSIHSSWSAGSSSLRLRSKMALERMNMTL